jgi:quinohemoprotein amine dehydrogenase
MKKKFLKSGLAVITLVMFFFMTSSLYGKTFFSKKSSVVREQCGACHKSDKGGHIEVIEETRKTPEEWKVVVDRMIRLNDAPVSDASFYPVVKELSRSLCLSPDEMAKVSYINSDENSQYREAPAGKTEQRIYTACVRCHTFGKIASHKMTKSQWAEIRNLHLGYYSTTIPQMREMNWAQESEELVKPLSEMFPFDSSGWKNWLKKREEQDLSGKWKGVGFQPGAGYYVKLYSFKPNKEKGEDEYYVDVTVVYENGTLLKMSGKATLFSEYHLRYALAPTHFTGRIEGVFDLNAAEKGFAGKWWTVVQDSNAYGDERFYRIPKKTTKILGHYPGALKADSRMDQEITLVGVNLPKKITTRDINFSDSNIKIKSVKRVCDSRILCRVSLTSSIATGKRTIKVKMKETSYNAKLTVFKRIDGIEIFPAIGRARVSCGAAYPPHGVQFVARGINFGPDKKANTKDDLILEPVDAKWWLEEEETRENDDDLKYLKAPITNGLYTPVTTYGPIEERFQRREGVGLIAVHASCFDDGRKLSAKARLAVTDPDFITHIK